jgi:hypothetical protein
LSNEEAKRQSAYQEIVRKERLLEKSFQRDAGPDLELADRAVSVLAAAMASVAPHDSLAPDEVCTPRTAGVDGLTLYALQTMGVRALRVIRSARASLASGYEPEALVNDRILIEFVAHRKEIATDRSGDEARAWLEAESSRGITKRVAKVAPEGLYGFLSQSSHGDPRPLSHVFDYDRETFRLSPRRTGMTTVCLLLYAMFAYDQAVLIAAFARLDVSAHADLKEAIQGRLHEVQRTEASWRQ